MPRRAGRREGAGHREQGDALAREKSPLVVGCGPSGVAMVSGTSGRRSPTWMVMSMSPVGIRSKRPTGARRGQPLKACRAVAARGSLPALMDEPRFLSGKLLLAMPGMADPRFERAVIAMCVHDENGAVGIGIGHKRAGHRASAALLAAARHRPGRGARLRRSITAGRSSRARLRPPFDRLGRAGHAPGHRPDWDCFAMTGTIDVLQAIAEGQGPDAVARRARLCRLGRGPARRGNDPPRLVRGRRRASRSCSTRRPTSAGRRRSRRKAIDPRLLSSETGAA